MESRQLNRLLAGSGILRLAKPWVRKLLDSAFGALPDQDREEVLAGHERLQSLAYGISPSFRATESEAALSHEVL